MDKTLAWGSNSGKKGGLKKQASCRKDAGNTRRGKNSIRKSIKKYVDRHREETEEY